MEKGHCLSGDAETLSLHVAVLSDDSIGGCVREFDGDADIGRFARRNANIGRYGAPDRLLTDNNVLFVTGSNDGIRA